MVHYSSRRKHGLYPHEFGPVYRAVHEKLVSLVKSREYLLEAEILFKVLWRFDNCRTGRPQYPEEITWGLINGYINGALTPLEVTPVIKEASL